MNSISNKIVCTFFICLGYICTATAQTNVVTDSSITYVNGEGLFIKLGKGENNKFNILSTIQSGIQFNRIDSTNTNRFSLNLVRVAFNASLLKDKVSMGFITDFAAGSPILEGWIAFNVIKKHGKFYMGQRQTHTNNRLAMADERFAQTLAQSIAGKSNDGLVHGGLMKSFVGASREGGLFLETKFNAGKWKIYPSVSITTGDGQNFFDVQTNTGFKYGGRLDVLPLGDFTNNNAFIAEDIYREATPKLAIGFAGSYNVKATSPMGSESNTIGGVFNKDGKADFANYGKIVADFIFKVKGFSLIGEYTNATVQGKELYLNAAASNKLTPQAASALYNLGTAINFQTAYVTKDGWSFGGRYSSIKPEFDIATSLINNQSWYTFSLNKFLKDNAVKAGVNVTYIEDKMIIATSKQWFVNMAVQISL
jgi:hypothetical protein